MDSKGLVIVAVGLPGAGKSRFHEKFLPDVPRTVNGTGHVQSDVYVENV